VMPADFCELGISRFEDDLKRFGYIAGDILQSLREAAVARRDWRTVYPPSRYEKWDTQSAMPPTKPLPQRSTAPPGSPGS
jgi:hypothetical protein